MLTGDTKELIHFIDYLQESSNRVFATVAITKEPRRVPRPTNQRRARKQQRNLFSNSGRRN